MISVIIPTFNRAKTIQRAVNSVLKQTYKDIEVIIIDDGSTDNTEDIIKEINNSKIKYIKLDKNYGACYARNVGINMAKGEYLTFQDSDDEWVEEKLQLQLNNLKANNSDIDFCSILICNKKSKRIPNEAKIMKMKKKGIKRALLYSNFVSTQAILGKTECFKREMFDNEMLRLQDYDLILRMSNYFKISYTKKVLVKLFIQKDSIGNDNKKLIQANLRIIKKNYNLNKKEKKILVSKRNESIGNAYLREKKIKEAKEYYIKSMLIKMNTRSLLKFLYVSFCKR